MEDKDYQFQSIEEAGNYVQDLKDKVKRRAGHEDFPVTTALPEERRRFLSYCVNILAQEKGRKEFVELLKLRVQGYSTIQIARYFKVPEEVVDVMEGEAVKRVKDAIVRRKGSGVPLVGG